MRAWVLLAAILVPILAAGIGVGIYFWIKTARTKAAKARAAKAARAAPPVAKLRSPPVAKPPVAKPLVLLARVPAAVIDVLPVVPVVPVVPVARTPRPAPPPPAKPPAPARTNCPKGRVPDPDNPSRLCKPSCRGSDLGYPYWGLSGSCCKSLANADCISWTQISKIKDDKIAAELERKRLIAAEAERQRQAAEAERKRLAEAERQRQAAEAERKRQAIEAEKKRQAEAERQRQAAEAEKKRLADIEVKRLADIEAKRLADIAEKKRLEDAQRQNDKSPRAVLYLPNFPYSAPPPDQLPRSSAQNTERGPDEAATKKRILGFGQIKDINLVEFKTGTDGRIYPVLKSNLHKGPEMAVMVEMNRRLGLLYDHLVKAWGAGDWRVKAMRPFVTEKYSRLGQGNYAGWGMAGEGSVFYASVAPLNAPWYNSGLDATWFDIHFDNYVHEFGHVLCNTNPDWAYYEKCNAPGAMYENAAPGHSKFWMDGVHTLRLEAAKAGLMVQPVYPQPVG